MATLDVVRAVCRCGHAFTTWHPRPLGMNVTLAGTESDERAAYPFEDPTPYLLSTCPKCSFTAGPLNFVRFEAVGTLRPGENPEPVEQTRHEVEGLEFWWPIVNLQDPPYPETALRWLLAARFFPDESQRFEAYLPGSHAARLAGVAKLELALQKAARAGLMERLQARPPDAFGIVFLIGELSRRMGDFDTARQSFEVLLAEARRRADDVLTVQTRRWLALVDERNPRPMWKDGTPLEGLDWPAEHLRSVLEPVLGYPLPEPRTWHRYAMAGVLRMRARATAAHGHRPN